MPKFMLYLAGLSLAACGAAPEGQSAEAVADNAASPAVVDETPASAPAPTQAAATVKLSGAASAASLAATEAGARRNGWSEVEVSRSQSFRLMAGEREVATLVTGEATLAPDVPGCFAGVVQGDRVTLVPTIGQGDYEATACGGPVAAGILSPGEPTSIGVVFKAYSPNAEVLEPIAFTWDAATNRFAIDAARSKQASLAGAQSIADMKRTVR
ncbi:hypothetical protein [uncultured Sphingomonas sp.]|uniref:hypothetical protein n=1 Tax=uncultured Sphingomonas sp. TaxID=158754 RepID=UPI0025D58270|nr:hypothetical protein [uncultured Sphingomonas sp.]